MKYTIQDITQGKRLIISRPFDTGMKWLNGIIGVLVVLAGLILIALTFSNSGENFSETTLIVLVVLTVVGAGWLFGAALQKEYLDFSKGFITYYNKRIRLNVKQFDISRISKFRHVISEEFLNGKYHIKKIAFEFEGETIVFGTDIFSWDYEQLERIFYEFSNNDLRFTDEEEAKPGFDPNEINSANSEDMFDINFQKKIDEFGWGIIKVPCTGYFPAFAFTVGLWQQFRHPELLCVGQDIDNMQGILNEAAGLVKNGKRIGVGTVYEGLLDGYGPIKMAISLLKRNLIMSIIFNHYWIETFTSNFWKQENFQSLYRASG